MIGKKLGAIAVAGLCAISIAYAAPSAMDGADDFDVMQLADNNSSAGMSGMSGVSGASAASGAASGSDDMNADTATGDDDY